MPDSTTIFGQEPDFDTIGGRLLRAREAAGLSVKDMAWRLGLKIATIKAWESDRAQPDARMLTMISGLLSVSLSWILHGVGTSPDERDDAALVDSVGAQLDRLRFLHAETGQLITRIEGDLERLRPSPTQASL